MSNTHPVTDTPERVADLLDRAGRDAACRVLPIGAASHGHLNERWADFAALKAAGCVAITDDAFPLQGVGEMTDALLQAAEADIPFIAHCEVVGLSAGGAIDISAPSVVVARRQQTLAEAASIRLWAAAYERAASSASGLPRLHLAHVSSSAALAPLAALRRDGGLVSAETAPHYFALTSEAVCEHGPNAKMNPPLKAAADRDAIRTALGSGLIEAIATDHAPHAPDEKQAGLDEAPFGVVGLETSLAVTLTELVEPGRLALMDAVAPLTWRPARLFGIGAGTLAAGSPADVAVVEPETAWTVDPTAFRSSGRNTPFAGRTLRGRVRGTFVGGRLAFRDGEDLSD